MSALAVVRPVRRGSTALAVAVVMAITMNAFEAMSVVTAMPAVTADLHGDSLYGAAFSAYMLASLVALVTAGDQADRRGPAVPFLFGVGSFATGLLVAGLAPSMPVLVLGRALQGAGAGTLASVAYVAVGRSWPVEEQPRIFAWMAAGWVVPSLVAPVAAGFTSEHIGWRWVFLGLLPLLPVLVVLALPSLRTLPPPDTTPGPSRVRAALTLAAGVGLVVLGLASSRLWILVPATVAGVAIAFPALSRLLPAGALRAARGAPAVITTRLCVNLAFFGTDTFIPLAATRIHGVGTLAGGLVITGASLTWTLGSALSARSAGRDTPSRTIRLGFLAIVAGIALAIPIVWSGVPLAFTFVAWMVAGLGIGLVFNTTSSTAMAAAPTGSEGLVSSQLQVADALGFALVGGIGGALVGVADRTSLSLSAALGIQFVLALGVAVAGVLLSSRVGADSESQHAR